ncbi:hypothetical protein ACNTMW_08535 [Planosporangium sp. 12N6]
MHKRTLRRWASRLGYVAVGLATFAVALSTSTVTASDYGWY